MLNDNPNIDPATVYNFRRLLPDEAEPFILVLPDLRPLWLFDMITVGPDYQHVTTTFICHN